MKKYAKGKGEGGRNGDTFHPVSAKNRGEMAAVKKVAKVAPPDTTKRVLKDSKDSKGPTANAWTKGISAVKEC